MNKDKKEANQLIDDTNKVVEYIDGLNTEDSINILNESASHQGPLPAHLAQLTNEPVENDNADTSLDNAQSVGEEPVESAESAEPESVPLEVDDTEIAAPNILPGVKPEILDILEEDVLNNFDLNDVPFGDFRQPETVPRDFGIANEFEPTEEYTGIVDQLETPVVQAPVEEERCPEPEGLISFEEFLNEYCEEVEPSFYKSYEDYEGLDEYSLNVAVKIEDVNQLRDAIECINEYSYNSGASANFTLFLGDANFNYDDLSMDFNDYDQDIDIELSMYSDVSLKILGCGCEDTVLDANRDSRLFDIHSGNVTIEKVKLTGGSAHNGEGGSDFDGGAIYNRGDLTLIDSCVVDNCAVDDGGGIYTRYDSYYGEGEYYYGEGEGDYYYLDDYDSGDDANNLTLINSIVNNNKAGDDGGGIYSDESNVNVLQGSEVNDNYTGVYIDENCEIDDGSGGIDFEDGDGGGIHIYRADLLVDASEVKNNQAGNSGGGIFAEHTIVEVLNESHVDRNIAHGYGEGEGSGSQGGGGILIYYRKDEGDYSYEDESEYDEVTQILTVDNSTVDWNRSYDEGGGIYFEYQSYDSYAPAPDMVDDNTDYHYEIINGSSVSYNRTYEEDGAGIYHYNGYGLVQDSTISTNIITELDTDEHEEHAELDELLMAPIPTGPIEDYFFDDIVDVFEDYVGTASGSGIYFRDEDDGMYGDQGILTIDNTILTRNMGGEDDGDGAGALYIGSGNVYISKANFISNYTMEDVEPGAAIFLDEGTIKYITNSTFTGNASTDDGGAIYNEDGTIELINNTTFSNNYADYSGGAIYNGSTIEQILNSTFSENYADGDGGAIYNDEIISIIINSTFSSNYADDEGGAIYNYSTIDEISFTTIAFNTPNGIYAASGSTIGNLNNTIVASNANDDDLEGFGTITSEGFNLIGGDPSPGLIIHASDMFHTDPMLSPTLALNGSTLGTETHALLFDSPAIDAANTKTKLLVDQRDFVRPVDGPNNSGTMDDDMSAEYDIGAFEYGSTAILVPPIIFDLDGDGIELISPSQSNITLLDNDGQLYKLGWVSGDDALLVYDNNHDGVVNSLAEIELSRYHPDAMTDLQGLSLAFDTNFDNLFNSMDDEFDTFGIWQDANENGITETGEYLTLVDAGINEIDLTAVESSQWVADNIIYAEGLFSLNDGTQGTFADVALTKEIVLDDGIEGIENQPPTFNEVDIIEVAESFAIAPDALVEHTIQESSTVHDMS